MTRFTLTATIAIEPITAALAVALLLAATIVPPIRAEHAPGHDPATRLELVVRRIVIHDDRDWGEGDFKFTVTIWEVIPGCEPGDELAWYWSTCRTELVASRDIKFGADDDEAVKLDRVIPGAGDSLLGSGVSPGIGFPVYADRTYGWEIKGIEEDSFSDDTMGDLAGWLNQPASWSIGTTTGRGWRNASDPSPYGENVEPGDQGFCVRTGPEGCARAHFSVEYEIRRAPLPDLRANTIKHLDAGPLQFYCVVVENVGELPSDSFALTIRAGQVAPGNRTMPALDVYETTEACMERSNLPAGEHQLLFRIDEAHQVAEMDETNNEYQWRIAPLGGTPAGPPGFSSPASSPVPIHPLP
jgi:hypothetical protein